MKYKIKRTEAERIREERIIEAERKARQLPEDVQLWFNGFAEGIIRGRNLERIGQLPKQ